MQARPEFIVCKPRERVAEPAARVTPLHADRLASVKLAYTARRVPRQLMNTLIEGVSPKLGDLVLCRVEALSSGGTLELASGRSATLFAGDEIVVCYGNHPAATVVEGAMPADLGPCVLLSPGGIAGAHAPRTDAPAPRLLPMGLVGDAMGRRQNTSEWSLPRVTHPVALPPVVLVVATDEGAGLGQTAAHLVRGFSNMKLRVGAARVTGRANCAETHMLADAGATAVLDFTDAGLPSTTHLGREALQSSFSLITEHLAASGSDVIVMALADGLGEAEVRELLLARACRDVADAVLVAASDSLSAAVGVDWLRRNCLPLAALSGRAADQPAALRDLQTAMPALAILPMAQLCAPTTIRSLGIDFSKPALPLMRPAVG